MTRPSLRSAVNAKCKSCIYDSAARGNWREQVSECSSANCSLHPLRPISSAHRRNSRVEAALNGGKVVLRVHGSENGLPGPSTGMSERGAA